MELRLLSTFLTVANLGSFTQAADQLNYAQSSVTSQVQALENELGVRLFERLGKNIALTEEGRRLLPYARQILNLSQDAREAVSPAQTLNGPLVIGAPESLFAVRLGPLLSAFRLQYPEVEISLRFGSCSDFSEYLRDGIIDLAFYIDRRFAATPYVTLMEWPEQLALLAAPGHPLAARGAPISVTDLEGASLILCEQGCTYREMLRRMLEDAGVTPGSTLESSSVQVMKQLAADGFGVTLLPRVAVLDELRDGRLAELPWADQAAGMEELSVRMVRHKDKWVTPAMRAFLQMAQQVILPCCNGQPDS